MGAAAALVLAAPGAALAQHAAHAGHADDENVAVVTAGQAAVDASGNLRAPTHDEVKQLTEQLRQRLDRSGQPASRVSASGMKSVTLDESYHAVSLARVADGKAETRCVESADEAKEFLAHGNRAKPAPAAPTLEEK
jgi:hypothetical protein